MTKLDELAAQLEAAETVDEINETKSAIEAERARLDAVAEKGKILESLKASKPVAAKSEPEPKTLGEYAAKHLDLSGIREGYAKSAATPYSFKADPLGPHMALPTYSYDMNVVDQHAYNRQEIRDLFGSESISGNSLTYFVLTQNMGEPDEVDEGGAKPQILVDYTAETVTLQKIAGWYWETDELLEDNAFLRSSIDNRALDILASAADDYIIASLLDTLGDAVFSDASNFADGIFESIMDIKEHAGLDADAIIINPADYAALRLAKDGGSTGQYYGGGYFYGPYGNGALSEAPGIWGLKTIVTNKVDPGNFIVGAFKHGASVITKAGEGVRLEVVTGDHEDRTHNRVTVVVEERLALAVRNPYAFAYVTTQFG